MWKLLTGRRQADTPEPAALASGQVIDGPALELVPASVLLGERVRQRLTAMRLESGMEEKDFARLIMAPMAAIAEWVQQVPATPDEYHCEAGGMMRLAVECATVAMRRADGKLFHRPGTGPAGGVQSDTAWRHAAVLAALFCTIGRHVGHWRVQNATGDRTWNPYAYGLREWVPKHSPGGYVITGAQPTNSVSRAGAGAWIAAKCLDAGCLSRLQHGDGAPMGALVDVLGGHTESTLGSVVEAASRAVMAEDRNRARLHPARRMPPVQQQLLSVMRGLVQFRWNINQPGGRLIMGPDGVYLHWERAAEDILARWRADHHADPAIGPKELGTLLLEHGLVEPNPDAANGPTPLQRVLVTPHEDGPTVPATCVRLPDPRIFALDVAGVQAVDVRPLKTETRERRTQGPGAASHEPAVGAAEPERADSGEHAPREVVPRAQKPRRTARAGASKDEGRPRKATATARETGEPQRSGVTPSAAPAPTPDGYLPGMGRYGEVGRVLSTLAGREGTLVPVEDGVALRASALQGRMTPKRFLAQARQQGILVSSRPRPGAADRTAPDEPHIVLVPRMAKLLGME